MRRFWNRCIAVILYVCLLSGCGFSVHNTESQAPNSQEQTEREDSVEGETSQDKTEGSNDENEAESEGTEGTSEDSETETSTEVSPVEPVVETLTITATGDCALGALQYHGYSKSFHEYYDKYGEAYFFANFADIFAQDDITIVNLECVFTDETKRVEKTYNIKGFPHYTGILTSNSVEVC